MAESTGVYITKKKDGTNSYRVSLTYRRKHISLGSYEDYATANAVYLDGRKILDSGTYMPEDYSSTMKIPHEKYIILANFRNNGIYFPTPIYLRKQYFEYYLTQQTILKFDRDDLFFYASHKIGQKGGYLFVSNYGSQYKILSRYGIKPFAVYERDYVMVNGDKYDYRYSNIRILNQYMGVMEKEENGTLYYETVIHINGNYIVGRYPTEIEAAVAYNKAVDTLHMSGFTKAYIKNYIVTLDTAQYLRLYETISISKKLLSLTPDKVKE